jgi:hypothetical protein
MQATGEPQVRQQAEGQGDAWLEAFLWEEHLGLASLNNFRGL